jgi:hypothetical protein
LNRLFSFSRLRVRAIVWGAVLATLDGIASGNVFPYAPAKQSWRDTQWRKIAADLGDELRPRFSPRIVSRAAERHKKRSRPSDRFRLQIARWHKKLLDFGHETG